MSEHTGSWQPDPFGRHHYRYWDGSEWTDQVSDDGVVSTDPPVADPTGATPAGDAASEPAAPAGDAAPSEPAAPVASDPAASEEPAAPAEPATPTGPVAGIPGDGIADPAPGDATTSGQQGWSAPDATTAMPAAGSPPPPTTTQPAATGGDGDGDGGGNNMALIVIGVIALLGLLGVGAYFLFFAGDDDEEAGGEMVSFLQDEEGLSESQARCVVDELDGRMSDAELRRLVESEGEDGTPANAIAYSLAMLECAGRDIETAGPTTTEPEDDDDTTTTTTAGGTQMPPAMMAMMGEMLADELGISTDQAECLFTGIFENMSSEQMQQMMTNPDGMFEDWESMTVFFQVFDECGIDPRDLDPAAGGGGGSGGLLPGQTYGDNPTLDALWDACEDGDGEACDELFFSSQVDSEYEEFGDTCGNRFPGGTVMCANENLN